MTRKLHPAIKSISFSQSKTSEITADEGLYLRVVESPDDGGFYAVWHDREGRDVKATRDIYPSENELRRAIRAGTAVTEPR